MMSFSLMLMLAFRGPYGHSITLHRYWFWDTWRLKCWKPLTDQCWPLYCNHVIKPHDKCPVVPGHTQGAQFSWLHKLPIINKDGTFGMCGCVSTPQSQGVIPIYYKEAILWMSSHPHGHWCRNNWVYHVKLGPLYFYVSQRYNNSAAADDEPSLYLAGGDTNDYTQKDC